MGFVSFALDWRLGPDGDDAELEIEPDQVWIAPAFRQQGWGCSLAYTVASAARMHLELVHALTKWRDTGSTPLDVLLGAEIYSTSGQRFLRQCYERFNAVSLAPARAFSHVGCSTHGQSGFMIWTYASQIACPNSSSRISSAIPTAAKARRVQEVASKISMCPGRYCSPMPATCARAAI